MINLFQLLDFYKPSSVLRTQQQPTATRTPQVKLPQNLPRQGYGFQPLADPNKSFYYQSPQGVKQPMKPKSVGVDQPMNGPGFNYRNPIITAPQYKNPMIQQLHQIYRTLI